MKKMTVLIAALFALSTPLAALAMDHESMPMDHGTMPMDHGSMKMEHGGHMMEKVAHEEVVDGVKATFSVLDIKAKMKEMGMKETHHIMVVFTDANSGAKSQLNSWGLEFNVIPEPGTLGLLLLGASILWLFRIRQS